MTTPFLNISFPPAVARGSTGGPGFSTTVVALHSGAEQRNQNWAKARGEWDISTGVRTRDQMTQVIAHFYAVAGRAHSFRFKDWNDFDATDQPLVLVSATVFQLSKTYQRGATAYVRSITKPVAGSVVVKVSGAPVTPQSIDYLTGLVTFAAPPASTPTASFQFDVPVRFDTDKLPIQANAYDQQIVSQITLVEVRE